jgi:D-glycero-D-manno-heptose 1,7-bisphosphate phosphatase
MNSSRNTSNIRRAIFLDRDGTLNEEVGYITDASQFRLYDFAADVVRSIVEANWRVIVVTNQAGVARGLYTEAFLAQLHANMEATLQQRGARLDAIYHCPHHPEIGEPPYRQACDCRKPRPGMLRQAAADFNLHLPECFVIGDRYGDVEMAQAVGAQGVLVLTGHGREEFEKERHLWPRPPDYIAANLPEAVRWILKES